MASVATPVKKSSAKVVAVVNSSRHWPLQNYPHFLNHMAEGCAQLFVRYHQEWPVPWGELILGKTCFGAMDVEKRDHAYVLKVEAPGFAAEDFDLRLTSDRLLLQAKADPQQTRKQEYCQTLTLPAGIDLAHAAAIYQDGILTVTLPMVEDVVVKQLTVKQS